jgi:LCP family protein required for cell wall assembly
MTIPPPETVTADTQPVRPFWRRRWNIRMMIVFYVMLVPLFLCGLCSVFYLVFPPAHVDLLVMGLDARKGEGFLARTDSIMLIGIDPAQLRVSVLSIPRDVFIEVPGYGSQRINTINLLAEEKVKGSGPTLLSESIAQDFGVRPDRYVRLNFQTFVDLVNAVGGVTIDVDRVIVDDSYPTEDGGTKVVRFESGVQTMDGERALIYARTRHSDDDYHRASRQQQVVSALASKLANPVHWLAVWNVLHSEVDTNLTLWDMVTLTPPAIANAGRYDELVLDRQYLKGAVPNHDLIKPWLIGRFQ